MFERHSFDVPVVEGHVNCTGQFFFGRLVCGNDSRTRAMARYRKGQLIIPEATEML